MSVSDDLHNTSDISKKLLRHYVKDKEQIVIDRRQFRATRHPDSTEHIEIIEINAVEEVDCKR